MTDDEPLEKRIRKIEKRMDRLENEIGLREQEEHHFRIRNQLM